MIFNFQSNSRKNILIIISAFIGFIFLAWLSKDLFLSKNIRDYNPKDDREFILKLFKNNWYWLVSEYSTDFSAQYMLDNKSSSKESKNTGNLTIKMYYEDSKPVGFIAYYMKELFVGYILFIAIDEQSRGKGSARKLLEYAINDLKNRQALSIQLVTRVSNLRGQKLYTGMGFKQIWTDGEFVRFEKIPE